MLLGLVEKRVSSLIQRLHLSTRSHRFCPYCHSHRIFRERRKGLVWALSLFRLRPYRCRTCYKVHFGFYSRR